MSRKRLPAAVASEALAKVVAEYATVPDFLNYSESLTSQLNKNRILFFATMWKRIHEISDGTLAFSQKVTEAMFETVRGSVEKSWRRPLSKTEAAEWRASAARQFRTMARHIANAKLKKYTWVMKMLGLDGSGTAEDNPADCDEEKGQEGEDEGGEEEDKEHDDEEEPETDEIEECDGKPLVAMKRPAQSEFATTAAADNGKTTGKAVGKAVAKGVKVTEMTYVYGYDPEAQLAWRRNSKIGSKLEHATEFPVPRDDDDPSGHPIARFKDGAEVEIKTITVKDLKIEMLTNVGRGKLWENGDFHIKHKADRSPMLILVSSKDGTSKQVCQIHIRYFGNPTEDESIQKCLEKFKVLGEKLAAGTLPNEELYPARDAIIRETRQACRRRFVVVGTGLVLACSILARSECKCDRERGSTKPEPNPHPPPQSGDVASRAGRHPRQHPSRKCQHPRAARHQLFQPVSGQLLRSSLLRCQRLRLQGLRSPPISAPTVWCYGQLTIAVWGGVRRGCQIYPIAIRFCFLFLFCYCMMIWF